MACVECVTRIDAPSMNHPLFHHAIMRASVRKSLSRLGSITDMFTSQSIQRKSLHSRAVSSASTGDDKRLLGSWALAELLAMWTKFRLSSISIAIVALCFPPSEMPSQESLPDAPSYTRGMENAKTAPRRAIQNEKKAPDAAWPRELDRGDEKIFMYQPQLESWKDDEIRAYAAISVVKGKDKDKGTKYGVVWFTARTEVDKINRQVTLDEFQITRLQFPTMKNREDEFRSLLQAKLPGKTRIVALDRLQAALMASESAGTPIRALPVNNDPPEIIFSTKPAILVLIDGPPKFRDVGGTRLRLVLNSKSTILLDNESSKYYVNVLDGWMESSSLGATWSFVSKVPADMKEITAGIQERQKARAPEGSTPPSLKQANKEGKLPEIYVRTAPAELLTTEGAPQFESIAQARIDYVKNTSANIFHDPANSEFYVLVSGRWFKSESLTNGRWTFVDGKSLPGGFSNIPENSSKAGVLASIPGTAPAKEALIANSIPQTATITRAEARLDVKYDGDPQFESLIGTQLQYAVNTATPVIRVDEKNYYSLESAVWFRASAPLGPWEVATSVPESIYSIPTEAPLHFVTYVKVYRSTPEVVYVGYTPGYYGSVVSSTTMTVVYGTGFYYPPYIGSYWYGAPYTYGVGVATTWSSGTGWSLTIGVGYSYGYGYPYYYYPWWGPWGYYGPCCWGPAWGYGWGGYASTNVYGRWGNTAYANTQAAWANPYTGNYGAASRTSFQNSQRGTVGVAGRGTNTNIYTGNTVAGRGAVGYDPRTGIVAGAGAGYAGNIYSGAAAAGRGGFAYNTNTGSGVAVGGNNVYAGNDGNVYRYNAQSGNWSKNTGNGWESTNRPQADLKQQQQARSSGQMRTQNFSGSMGRGMGGGRRR